MTQWCFASSNALAQAAALYHRHRPGALGRAPRRRPHWLCARRLALFRASAGDEAAPQQIVEQCGRFPAEGRVSDLSLELHDLHGARSAMRSAAPAEHGSDSRGDEEDHISAPPRSIYSVNLAC